MSSSHHIPKMWLWPTNVFFPLSPLTSSNLFNHNNIGKLIHEDTVHDPPPNLFLLIFFLPFLLIFNAFFVSLNQLVLWVFCILWIRQFVLLILDEAGLRLRAFSVWVHIGFISDIWTLKHHSDVKYNAHIRWHKTSAYRLWSVWDLVYYIFFFTNLGCLILLSSYYYLTAINLMI